MSENAHWLRMCREAQARPLNQRFDALYASHGITVSLRTCARVSGNVTARDGAIATMRQRRCHSVAGLTQIKAGVLALAMKLGICSFSVIVDIIAASRSTLAACVGLITHCRLLCSVHVLWRRVSCSFHGTD
jgi:hypothetical protein